MSIGTEGREADLGLVTVDMQVERIQVPADPHNLTRTDPKSKALQCLAASINAQGQLSPIVVRPVGPDHNQFELVAGHRRLVAIRDVLGRKTIRASWRVMTDAEAASVTAVENLQREDLPPLDQAREISGLLKSGLTIPEVANRIGKSATWVARRASLMGLSPAWLKALEAGHLEGIRVEVLELVARMRTEDQEALVDEAGPDKWRTGDAKIWQATTWTVKRTEDQLADLTHELKRAPWKLDDGTLDPQRGSCSACQKTSASQPGLFAEYVEDLLADVKVARCLDRGCWAAKAQVFALQKVSKLRANNQEAVLLQGAWQEPIKGARHSYEFSNAKKAEKGAVALVDSATGAVTYGRRYNETNRASGGTKAEKPETPAAQLKERKEAMARRREALVKKRLEEAVEKLIEDPDPLTKLHGPNDLVGFLAEFGWPGSFRWEQRKTARKASWTHLQDLSVADAEFELWRDVAQVLLGRLRQFEQTREKEITEHNEIANYIGKDVEKLREQAKAELPDPKSWQALEAQIGRPVKGEKKKPKK